MSVIKFINKFIKLMIKYLIQDYVKIKFENIKYDNFERRL
jgi:hypothetical protein